MHGNKFSIDNDNTLPCANGYEYDGTPMAIQAAQLQINEILTGCNNTTGSIKEFTNDAKHKLIWWILLPKSNTSTSTNTNYIIPVSSSCPSCNVLLADSFTLVNKVNDQYPDEWYDSFT